MPSDRTTKAVYYLVALGFHWSFFFTRTGNYSHGGTPVEWIALQAVAVLIALAAAKLVPNVRIAEKILITLFAVVPLISLVWALVEAFHR